MIDYCVKNYLDRVLGVMASSRCEFLNSPLFPMVVVLNQTAPYSTMRGTLSSFGIHGVCHD